MERPTAVTVFGILNIVFAILGFFVEIVSVFLIFVWPNTDNPVLRIVQEQSFLYVWTALMLPVGMAFSMLKLAGGIGLLRMKPWGRKASILYGIGAIVLVCLGALVNMVFLFGPLMAEAGRSSGPAAAGAVGGAIGGGCGSFCGLIYPILLLVFMTRPGIVAAFRPPLAAPPVA